MMKKTGIVIAACALSVNLMAGAAFAKQEDKGAENHGKAPVRIELKVKADKPITVTGGTYGDTVTSGTYGHGHNGYKGSLNAIENVKDKPAGAVLADLLLTKYEAQLSDELKAQLEQIKDADAALSATADALADSGGVNDAVYVQKEAIKANLKNLKAYEKLGHLYEKLGKKGVKLYVNGEEPAFEVAPFIREGNTLVPFRAIAEALKANVSWDPNERSVSVTRGDITVKLFIDSKTAYVNGKEVTLEVPARSRTASTVVPVRFVSEALKVAVQWEGNTQSVVITEE
ncbi:copper amine oxidase N-terminal domain-containing protein [Paenibacillus sp. P26]|nr:copper amine oxidase N-terminal domain-containing protein [Paenibacillus sp. P26]